MDSIGTRLKAIRGPTSQQVFSDDLGVSLSTLSNYERDERPPTSEVLIRLDELGFNVQWLLTGKGSMRGGVIEVAEPPNRSAPTLPKMMEGPDPSSYVYVPRYKMLLPGSGVEIHSEQIVAWFAFSRQYLEFIGVSPSAAAVIRVTGDELAPRLQDGDTALVDRSDVTIRPPHANPRKRRVYALRMGGDGTGLEFRVVELQPDGTRHISTFDPDVSPVVCDGSTVVLGRLRWSACTFW